MPFGCRGIIADEEGTGICSDKDGKVWVDFFYEANSSGCVSMEVNMVTAARMLAAGSEEALSLPLWHRSLAREALDSAFMIEYVQGYWA